MLCSQDILVVWEEVTKFTQATIIDLENNSDTKKWFEEFITTTASSLLPCCNVKARSCSSHAKIMQSTMAKRHDHLDRPRGGQIDKITQVLQNELICNAKPQACLRLIDFSLSIIDE